MTDSLFYAKLPAKLKRSVKMASLENDSHDEIVAHLERELELNALEELTICESQQGRPQPPNPKHLPLLGN